MRSDKRLLTVLTTALIANLAPVSRTHAQQVGRAPLDIQVMSTPSALFALGRFQLVYEVRLTNFGSGPMTITRLDALDPTGNTLGSWRDVQLAQRMSKLRPAPRASPEKLLEVLDMGAGEVATVYLMIPLSIGIKMPPSIQHRAFTTTLDRIDTLHAAPVGLRSTELPRLQAPVEEGTWIALRGPSNSSGHRLSIVTLNGRAAIPQRYAIDWARLGPDGRLFGADSSRLENWYGYGSPVKAVAAGRVVWIRDGVAERAPFAHSAPETIEARDAVGNSVIIDLGAGAYATFAHLKPGSLQVKVGDTIRAGQTIGLIGNSGNSLAPHLHFHVSDAPGPLEGEGLPFVIPAFELLGRIQSSAQLLSGGAWTPNAAQPARSVTGETPLENMVVRFRK